MEDNKDTELLSIFYLEMLELRLQSKTEGALDGSLLWESAQHSVKLELLPSLILYFREEKKQK